TGGGTGSGVVRYTVVDLGVLSDPNNMAEIPHAINAKAEVAGITNATRGFLYTKGQLGGMVLDIGTPPGFTYVSANGINNSSQVVGSSWYMDGEIKVKHAVIYNTHDGIRDI